MTRQANASPGLLGQIACILECSAPKVGNVNRRDDFHDTSYLDFVISAAAVAPALDRAESIGVGLAILEAVEATRRIVGKNTNLGIILVLCPLAATPEGSSLVQGVETVLSCLSIEDCRYAYQAIRIANPGGLGEVSEQDVRDDPSVTLREAMAIAADRDLIARQYANGFHEVLRVACPSIERSIEQGISLETAIVECHLKLIAEYQDTLITRKRGSVEAAEASQRARRVLELGWPLPKASRAFDDLDRWLRAEGSTRNPGATADLVAAALFASLRQGRIALPLDRLPIQPLRRPLDPIVPGSEK